jgi:hypothetical protein
VNVRALTIPISPVAYGHRAADFPGLFMLKTRNGAFLVQRGERAGVRGQRVRSRGLGGNVSRRLRADLNFLFLLSFGVNQEGDDTVIPTADQYGEQCMTVLMGQVAKLKEGRA